MGATSDRRQCLQHLLLDFIAEFVFLLHNSSSSSSSSSPSPSPSPTRAFIPRRSCRPGLPRGTRAGVNRRLRPVARCSHSLLAVLLTDLGVRLAAGGLWALWASESVVLPVVCHRGGRGHSGCHALRGAPSGCIGVWSRAAWLVRWVYDDVRGSSVGCGSCDGRVLNISMYNYESGNQ